MDISAYISGINTAIQKVINPVISFFKLKSEYAKLQLEHSVTKDQLVTTKQKLEVAEHRIEQLEAPGHAKKLGYELCLCTPEPQIMLQIAAYKFKCWKCGFIRNTGATVSAL